MNVLDILKREVETFFVLRRTLKWLDRLDPESRDLVPDDIEAVIDRYGDNVAFRSAAGVITYNEFEARANKIANWALTKGLKAGDTVALFMENRSDYVAVWYGLSKIGVVTGLINHNLTDEALAHCINIAEAQLVITGAEQDAAIKEAQPLLEGEPTVWTLGGGFGEDLDIAIAGASAKRPDRKLRSHLRARDLCILVYTSGTTGLPKAARLTHLRTKSMMCSFIGLCDVKSRDRVYVPLPLYHSTGGICGVGAALLTGASLVLRDKFSATAFWSDVKTHGVTMIVYIGELCRYLINSPKHPDETGHDIRTGFGNGLRPDIWTEFRERFEIPNLVEFYGSTEGNVTLASFDGTVGAVGRIPGWLKHRFSHIAFVKFDVESEMPVRDADGFCIRTETDEAGEALGRIGDSARERFEGYQDEDETSRKVLRDVFEQGDMWFRTGDLMKMDEHGYIYFVDRIGDTFRWKGENVSTNEVSAILAKAPGIATANVYGVAVPGTDGKAGMAAITAQAKVDYDGLYAWLAERLPKYAIPLFIRVQKEAETTSTFKYSKVDLVREGFDPNEVNEPVWFYDPQSGRYEPLTPDAYETIKSGAVKF